MNEIISVYILDGEGGIIFIHEKYVQGSEDAIQSLWPKFLVAFQIFVSELGANETKIVLENNKIFTGYDIEYDVHFVLKCTQFAKTIKMKEVLKDIKNEFRRIIPKQYNALQELDSSILNSLAVSIRNIIEPIKNIDSFIEIL